MRYDRAKTDDDGGDLNVIDVGEDDFNGVDVADADSDDRLVHDRDRAHRLGLITDKVVDAAGSHGSGDADDNGGYGRIWVVIALGNFMAYDISADDGADDDDGYEDDITDDSLEGAQC